MNVAESSAIRTAASLEARYDWAVDKYYIQTIQFYIFYDAGAMWNLKNVGGVLPTNRHFQPELAPLFYLTRWVSGNIMWAQPLTSKWWH